MLNDYPPLDGMNPYSERFEIDGLVNIIVTLLKCHCERGKNQEIFNEVLELYLEEVKLFLLLAE